jgi:capsule biosynthesis phosphatase
MSLLYKLILSNNEPIKAIKFSDDIIHIGSLKELNTTITKISKPKMRVCFDLDNTLVTYPTIPGDYSSVKPITNIINLARQMKNEGHIIIIYTARRMQTHKNNIGSVIKDIGMQTFKTLEEFNIPYDELLFGKPIADIYIDDRSANPYKIDTIKHMGYITCDDIIKPINMLPTNKYNSINIDINNYNRIFKKGPEIFLRGELYYYTQIPNELNIAKYFPKYFGSQQIDENNIEICLENIANIPIYTLYHSQLLNVSYINKIFDFLDQLHNIKLSSNTIQLPTIEDIKDNYYIKLVKRFENKTDYPFEDSENVQQICLTKLQTYLNKLETNKLETNNITYFIRGDCWFSNILLDFTGNLKFIDMKGQINGKLTTGGDIMYDFGKLYQSILGYDLILYNHNIDENYKNELQNIFETIIINKNISLEDLKIVTFSLVIGTIHCIQNDIIKQNIWKWIKKTFIP